MAQAAPQPPGGAGPATAPTTTTNPPRDFTQRSVHADPADERAARVPDSHPAVADVAAGIARNPHVAIDITAHPPGPHLMPSTTQSVYRRLLDTDLPSLETSKAYTLPSPPTVSPGPLPVLMTYSVL